MAPELSGVHYEPTKSLAYTLLQDQGYDKRSQEAKTRVHTQGSSGYLLAKHPTQITNSKEVKLKRDLEKHSCFALAHALMHIWTVSQKLHSRD